VIKDEGYSTLVVIVAIHIACIYLSFYLWDLDKNFMPELQAQYMAIIDRDIPGLHLYKKLYNKTFTDQSTMCAPLGIAYGMWFAKGCMVWVVERAHNHDGKITKDYFHAFVATHEANQSDKPFYFTKKQLKRVLLFTVPFGLVYLV